MLLKALNPARAVALFCREHEIFATSICVALSGGADSVCLLLCLEELREELSLELEAVHIQHNLRGEESERDEAFCKEICRKRGIPLQIISVAVTEFARERGFSLEMAARECRYQAFTEHVRSAWIATAHTASDNAETLIMRAVRGAGLRGLCGIPPRREQFVRPLLVCSRKEIEEYLEERDCDYVIDHSNFDLAIPRNLVRHRVLPLLREQNPKLEHTLATNIASLRADSDYIESQARDFYTSHRDVWGGVLGLEEQPISITTRCMAYLLTEQGITVTQSRLQQLEQIRQQGGRAELIRGGAWAERYRGGMYLYTPQRAYREFPLMLGEQQLYEDATLCASIDNEGERIDCKRVQGTLRLHSHKEGLRIQLYNRKHRSEAKTYLATLPPPQRCRIHYLSDDEGLVWVEGLGIDERVRATSTQEGIVLYTKHSRNIHEKSTIMW